ncbi:MAG TPA: hypothetical protein VF409_14600 [Sphingomonas sp.]
MIYTIIEFAKISNAANSITYKTGTLPAIVSASVIGWSGGRQIKGVKVMSLRFASAQQVAVSLFSALVCTMVLVNAATSFVHVA